MKSLILLIIVMASFNLLAQDNDKSSEMMANDQTDIWMMKISSDSEMRIKMMDMMMVKTSGDKKEMMKLVNSILSNPEMQEMISSNNNARTGKESDSIEPRGMTNDSVKVKKMSKIKPVPGK
jgi:hypothetical protein